MIPTPDDLRAPLNLPLWCAILGFFVLFIGSIAAIILYDSRRHEISLQDRSAIHSRIERIEKAIHLNQ